MMTKKVIIMNWLSKYAKDGYIDAYDIHYSPDKSYAVVELLKQELFIAVHIRENNDEVLIGEYMDSYKENSSVVDLRRFSFDWSHTEYGFVILNCWELETGYAGMKKRLKLRT